jgi:hypothetical protein
VKGGYDPVVPSLVVRSKDYAAAPTELPPASCAVAE